MSKFLSIISRYRLLSFTLFSILLLLLTGEDLLAQCPMCKAAAESNLKEGGSHARGLNHGILYLFVTPYLLAMTIAGIWYYRNVYVPKKEAELEQLEAEVIAAN